MKALFVAAPVMVVAALVAPAAVANAAPAAPAAAPAAQASTSDAKWIDGVKLPITNKTGRVMYVDGVAIQSGQTSNVKADDNWQGAKVAFDVTLPNGKSGFISATNPMAGSTWFFADINGRKSGEMKIDEDTSYKTKTDTIGTVELSSSTHSGWRNMNMTILTCN